MSEQWRQGRAPSHKRLGKLLHGAQVYLRTSRMLFEVTSRYGVMEYLVRCNLETWSLYIFFSAVLIYFIARCIRRLQAYGRWRYSVIKNPDYVL